MNTRHMGLSTKVIASVLAGAMTLGYSGGASLVRVAMAQEPAPKAAAPKADAPKADATKAGDAKAGTAAGTTTAQPSAADLKKARAAYADGEKKFKAGDYQAALESFQTADSIKPTPQTARYIGQAQEKLGKYPEAVAAYERYLAGAALPKEQKQVDETKASVDKIKAMPGKLHVEAQPAGATVAVGDKPAVPTPTDLELAPGKYVLKFEAPEHLPTEKEVDVAYASTAQVSAQLEKKPEPPPPPPPAPVAEEPPPPPPPPPPAEPKSLVPAYVTGGLALVAAGVGTGFGIAALNTKSEYDQTPTAEIADRGENQALIADMSFGIAVTLAVTSLVLFVTSGSDDSAAPKTGAAGNTTVAKKNDKGFFTAAPVLTKGGGGAGALLRF